MWLMWGLQNEFIAVDGTTGCRWGYVASILRDTV
jgi:hypothetical protein